MTEQLPQEPRHQDTTLMLHTIELLSEDEVRQSLAYILAGAETFLPLRDGEESADWLYVQGMRRARLECEKAREMLGHYPLCEALERPEDVAGYCMCERWAAE